MRECGTISVHDTWNLTVTDLTTHQLKYINEDMKRKSFKFYKIGIIDNKDGSRTLMGMIQLKERVTRDTISEYFPKGFISEPTPSIKDSIQAINTFADDIAESGEFDNPSSMKIRMGNRRWENV